MQKITITDAAASVGVDVAPHERLIQERYNVKAISDGKNINIGADILTLLKFVSLVVTLAQVGVFIYFLVSKIVHMYMFTWWNQVFFTCFIVLLLVGIFFQRWLLWLDIVVLMPFQTGLTTIVSIAIVILIKENPDLLMKNSTYEGGDLTMDMIHTGDWILHNAPVVILYFALFVGGLWLLARAIIGNFWRQLERSVDRLVYCVFFLCAPLLPLALYSVSIGIHTHYPTDIPDYILWLGLLSITFAIQGLVFLSFVLTSSLTIEIPKVTTVTRPKDFFASLSIGWPFGTSNRLPTQPQPLSPAVYDRTQDGAVGLVVFGE